MPTYQYVCAKCRHEFELVQSIKEAALKICPRQACPRKPWGKGKVRRRISTGGGLLFKGSGFYATDYRSENYKTAAKKDTDSQTPAKTETKPATPAQSKPAASAKSAGGPSAAEGKSAASPSPGPAREKD